MSKINKLKFSGEVISVKARIRLIRSFDEISHQYLGYILIMNGLIDSEEGVFKVAIGPKAHEKHQFRIKDVVEGQCLPIPESNHTWSEFYKVSALKLLSRDEGAPTTPSPIGGVPPELKEFRTNSHLRLKEKTWEEKCFACPFGLNMPVEIIIDHWNPNKKKFRYETHCYGPKMDCPNYEPGPPYRVQGRKKGMIFVDEDFENWE